MKHRWNKLFRQLEGSSRDGIIKRAEKSNRQDATAGGTIRSFNQSGRP
jgi:hypothetical protein